jgi:hypothetical protein
MLGCEESGAGCEDVWPPESAGVEFCSGVDWFGLLSAGGGGGPIGALLSDELCPPSAGVEFCGAEDDSGAAELIFWSDELAFGSEELWF